MNGVLIVGQHPVREDIVGQFRRLGRDVAVADSPDSACALAAAGFGESVILTSPDTGDALHEDARALELLRTLAQRVPRPSDSRPVVHLLLQSGASLRMLQTMDLPDVINDAFEVEAFTMEDVWAENIFVRLPGVGSCGYPPLDREPVTAESQKFVHLVIAGFGAQARAVAVHAALVAHYPNYNGTDRHPLRTRITVIDRDMTAARDAFVAEYRHLFDHSFYRTVYPAARRTELHRPMYHGVRADFVDVEWEFVDACTDDAEVRRKLMAWACDERRLLTVAVAHDSDERNLSESMSLPSELGEMGIPVFVRLADGGIADVLRSSGRHGNLHPFGMRDRGYDVTRPLTRMAKLLKYFYDCSYSDLGVPTGLPWPEAERAWQAERSFVMRFSNRCNVMTIPSKMHSLGRDAADADTFYALTRDEIAALAAAEHNRWSVERLITGSRPCTDSEREAVRKNIDATVAARRKGEPLPADLKRMYKRERNVHYDLCAYDELGIDPTGKSAKTYDYDLTACIPLIVKTFFDGMKNG